MALMLVLLAFARTPPPCAPATWPQGCEVVTATPEWRKAFERLERVALERRP